MNRKQFVLAAGSLLSCAWMPAARAQSAQNKGAMPPNSSMSASDRSEHISVATHYGGIVHAVYEDTLHSAKVMRDGITSLLRNPSAAGLENARKAWLDAREFYGQSEAFRFYSGPIDSDRGPEGRLNGWPMDESYVDYVRGKPNAGLINNRRQVITMASLKGLNERGGEENIATGWHAIEFMLWGQDLSETGPGQRTFEDFVDGRAPNADRRRLYLATVTELLIVDLGTLVRAWAPNQPNNYRAHFSKGGRESLRKMLVGMGSLSRGELAGERLEVALNSQDQEDEHSCFSDNTHRDVVANATGIRNVWAGEYRRRDGSLLQGPSLRSLVARRDSALADRLSIQINLSVAAAEGIQAPFDREIIGGVDAPGRKRVQKTVDSLTLQVKGLVDAAAAIGITRLTLVSPK